MHECLFAANKETDCYWYKGCEVIALYTKMTLVHDKELWLQMKVQGMLVTLPSYHELKLEHNKKK
jgi:hypothetical protein